MAKKRTRKQKKRAQQKRQEQAPTTVKSEPTITRPSVITASKPQIAQDTSRKSDKEPIIKDLLKTVWIAGIILGILLAVYFFF